MILNSSIIARNLQKIVKKMTSSSSTHLSDGDEWDVHVPRNRSVPRVAAAARVVIVHAIGVALGSALNPAVVILELAEFVYVTRFGRVAAAAAAVAAAVAVATSDADATVIVRIVVFVAVEIGNRRGRIHFDRRHCAARRRETRELKASAAPVRNKTRTTHQPYAHTSIIDI